MQQAWVPVECNGRIAPVDADGGWIYFFHPQILDYAATVLTLVVLEGLLSADNALVLAVMVRHLPDSERGMALRVGLLGAFVFRAIGVLLAQFLIRIWYLKALGAGWLFFLALKHFYVHYRSKGDGSGPKAKPRSFWMTVFWVECMDIAFSLDSILAAVAMSNNIYIVYLGGILGIVTMRFVAGVFLKLLDKYQGLETSAYLIVAWIGIKLSSEVVMMFLHPQPDVVSGHHAEGIPKWLFWLVMVLLFGGGLVFHPKKRDEASAGEPGGP